MKRTLLGIVLASAASTILAQQPASPPPAASGKPAGAVDQQMLQKALTESRRKLFSAGMDLTPAQFETFWAVYGDFEKEKNALDGVRIAIVKKVAERVGKASGDEALGLVAESADLQQKEITLRKKYADILAAKVSPAAGVRFWQIDDYITTALRLDLLDNIPLFKETSTTS
jgi:hypothetical protein